MADKKETIIYQAATGKNLSAISEYSPFFVDKSNTYLNIKMLAVGGFGKVSRGFDVNSRGFVAIKEVKEEMKKNEMVMDSFEREIDIVFKLSHPNIVKAFAHPPGIIIYDYVKSSELNTLLYNLKKRGLSLPLDSSAYIISSIASALAYAYFDFTLPGKRDPEKIVHRDATPQNILLLYDTGEVKLTDFGIAKALTGVSEMTRIPGTVKGKPHYMSPEQARGEELDHRSDLFALGIIFFEMVTSVKPIGGSVQMAFEKAKKGELNLNPLNGANIPEEVKKLILRMLEINKESRISSGREICEILRKYFSDDAKLKIKKITNQIFKSKIKELNDEMAFEIKHIDELKRKAMMKVPPEAVSAASPLKKIFIWAAGTVLLGAVVFGAITFGNRERKSGDNLRSVTALPIETIGTLNLTSVPSGADVYTKGENEKDFVLNPGKKTPCNIKLKEGMRVKLKIQGFEYLPPVIPDFKEQDIIKTQCWTGQKTGEREFELNGLFYKKVHIETNPSGARLIVNDEDTSKTTPCEVMLKAGNNKVKFVKKGFSEEEKQFEITSDKNSIEKTLRRPVLFKILSSITDRPISAKVNSEYFSENSSSFEKTLPYKDFTITVRKTGYSDRTVKVGKRERTKKIYLEPIKPHLTVRVKDENGKPVPAAFVRIGSQIQGNVDSNGIWKGKVSALDKNITVGRAGYTKKGKTLNLNWGQNKSIEFVLAREFSGNLVIDTRNIGADAEIYLDGKKQEYTGFLHKTVKGKHSIRIMWNNGR